MINDLKIIKQNRIISFSLIILFFISINSYLFFIITSIFFVFYLIYFDLLKILNKLNISLFKLFPLFFYVQKLINAFINQNKSIFWDMQLFIFELNCQAQWNLHYTQVTNNYWCTSLVGPFQNTFTALSQDCLK